MRKQQITSRAVQQSGSQEHASPCEITQPGKRRSSKIGPFIHYFQRTEGTSGRDQCTLAQDCVPGTYRQTVHLEVRELFEYRVFSGRFSREDTFLHS